MVPTTQVKVLQICFFPFVLTSRKGGGAPKRLKTYDQHMQKSSTPTILQQTAKKYTRFNRIIYLQHFAILLWGCLLDEEPKNWPSKNWHTYYIAPHSSRTLRQLGISDEKFLPGDAKIYWTPSLLIWQEISYSVATKCDVQCSSNVAGMVIFSQRR